jgi:hypothetical protein
MWKVCVAQWWSTGRMGSQLGAEALKSRYGTPHLRARCKPLYPSCWFIYRFRCVSETQTFHSWTLCCNRIIYVITHFYAGCVYVIYYLAIITYVMMPHGDPDETNRPCLRAGCHNPPTWKHNFYLSSTTMRLCIFQSQSNHLSGQFLFLKNLNGNFKPTTWIFFSEGIVGATSLRPISITLILSFGDYSLKRVLQCCFSNIVLSYSSH